LRVALTVDPELPVPPLHYGGIERVVDMLARTLGRRGHSVTLFAHPESTCPVELVAWPGRRSSSRRDTILNAAALARCVMSGRFDLVHSFARIAYLAPILPLAIPKLMSYQREISPRTTGWAQRLGLRTIEFAAISRQMIAAQPLSGKWHFVPNGVPLENFTFRPDVSADAPLVFLGRIEEIKGPHLAIEIARKSGRRLVIAGNVPAQHRAWFEAHVAPYIDGDRVTYVGPVNDEQKNRLLGKAFAFLMPILWEEPFGIVMAEAMACGTPVLALRRGAAPEVVEHGLTGFVADVVDELAFFVSRVPELSRAAARMRVKQYYSGDAVADAYVNVYEQVVSRVRFNRGCLRRHE
jgi:glycosyltransferase involved in cell wall biosynthesis